MAFFDKLPKRDRAGKNGMAATSYGAAACRKKGAVIKPSEKTKNDGFY